MKWRCKVICLIAAVLVLMLVAPVLASPLVNMEFKEAPLVDVFQILGEIGGLNVLVDRSVQGNVSFVLRDLTVQEALDLVARTTGYRYKLVGNTIVVATEERLRQGFSSDDFAFIAVEHVDAVSAQDLLRMIVPQVRAYVDEERQLLVVYGTSGDLELAERVIAQYDRPAFAALPETPAEVKADDGPVLVSQTIKVQYGDGAKILARLLEAYPERSFRWDSQTRLLVGQATDGEWKEIRTLVHQLDLPELKLKGLTEAGERSLALVEHEGQTVLLEVGESLAGWTLVGISGRTAEFTSEGRTITAVMGR